MQLREIERSDLDEVVRIENQNFASPWTEMDFVNSLKSCRGKVAVEGRVLGYIIFEKYGSDFGSGVTARKPGIRILNMAVLYKRQGIGRFMLENMFKCVRSCRVRESNLEAQLFFKAMGWKAIETYRNFYPNGESAYLFVEIGVSNS